MGRWFYPKDKNNLDRKIYLANYDNSGILVPKYLSMTLEEVILEKNKLSLHRLINIK